jgi:transcriptional regulator with XRE-family HTH domain
MARKKVNLLPSAQHALGKAGANIKKARLRRKIRAEILAERAGISADTLSAIEIGVSTVSIGAYAAVLAALKLDNDLEMIALDEEGKKQFKEHNLKKRERATKKIDNGGTDNGRE